MAKANHSAQQVRDVLDYNPDTGLFTWKVGRRAGKPAGGYGSHPYTRITIGETCYLAHRLAWLITHGEWPLNIDHIDGNPSNNRLANLRSVTHQTNTQNVRLARSNNRSGLLGVHWSKTNKAWVASLRVGPARVWIGRFQDKHEAHAKYLEAKRKLHAGCTI